MDIVEDIVEAIVEAIAYSRLQTRQVWRGIEQTNIGLARTKTTHKKRAKPRQVSLVGDWDHFGRHRNK